MNDLDLAQMIFGAQRFEQLIPVNNTTTIQAEAMNNSINGTVTVLIDNQPTEVSTAYAVKKGDICMVSVTNNSPIVIGVIGKGDQVDQVIDGTLRATNAVIMSLAVGTVDAEKLSALEGYIKNLTAIDFTAENIEATQAELQKLIAGDAKIDNLEVMTATIGTLEATKAFIEELEAGNVTAEKLIATNAFIEELEAKNITAETIAADSAYIGALETAYADVTQLVADLASIKELDVEKINATIAEVDNLEVNYAKIDLTNIEEGCIKTAYIEDAAITSAKIANAAIENAHIKDGAIHDANIADATITAAKIHDINADTITAGTLKTERLILVDNETGQTSIIKAINLANGVDPDTVSGNKIQAESIDVVDLYALNATIGGFKIGLRELYNGKESFTDPQSGVYVGLDGVAIGNGVLLDMTDKSPFMVKADGTFRVGSETNYMIFDPFTGKLNLDVSELKIAANDVGTALESMSDLEQRVSTNETTITQTANEVTIGFTKIGEEIEGNNENWNELRSYIRFVDGSMEMGASTNDFKTVITNNELAFMEGNNKVSYINSNSMFITKAEVTDTLAINNWKWEQRYNGNMSLKWRANAS